MKTIYKYALNLGVCHANMPQGAVILKTGLDSQGRQSLWALVDPTLPPVPRNLQVVGTGHPLPTPERMEYLGTFLDGDFVWHAFEVLPADEVAA